MNWFIWRQHNKQFLIFGILLAAFAGLLIPTGIHYWNTYQHTLATCAQNPATPSCNDLQDNLFNSQTDGFIRIAVVLGTFGLPMLVGLFIGSPLLAREYEEGTDKLAWTQSVSRRKWLTAKLAWALGFALLYGIALTLLATWWSRTLNALTGYRFIQGHFETQGLMPAAYCVFFTTVGFATGAWFRKTLVGFAITFGVFVVCMASFAQWIRPHYMTPVTITAKMGPDSKVPGGWVIRHSIVDKNGNTFDSFNLSSMPADCQAIIQQVKGGDNIAVKVEPGHGGAPSITDCLNNAGFRQVTTYQPAYRYWDFQRIEAGIYLGMTALAVGATYWLVLKRDA